MNNHFNILPKVFTTVGGIKNMLTFRKTDFPKFAGIWGNRFLAKVIVQVF